MSVGECTLLRAALVCVAIVSAGDHQHCDDEDDDDDNHDDQADGGGRGGQVERQRDKEEEEGEEEEDVKKEFFVVSQSLREKQTERTICLFVCLLGLVARSRAVGPAE